MDHEAEPANATHWSTRTLAAELGTSRAMVNRVWRANGLKPHLIRTFKLSNDRRFVEKLTDVVGLYLNPPEHALVLSVDEKSQIQALDRTQPGLPLKKGRCGTMTHDYKRNGTTTLFAALNVAEGKLIGTCMPRHRHQEWIKFLNQIDQQTPLELDLHLIADNYATHKHPKRAGVVETPPTLSHALHAHQQFVAESGGAMVPGDHGKRIRRGVIPQRRATDQAITDYIENTQSAAKSIGLDRQRGKDSRESSSCKRRSG